jgi:hypothetical protein
MKKVIVALTGPLLAALALSALFLILSPRPLLAAAAFQDDGPIPFPLPREAGSAAAGWLVETHQNDDGGYTSFSAGKNEGESDAGGTVDALLALAGSDADTTEPLSYLNANADELAAYVALGGGTAGKTLLALLAAGEDPADFAGHNFVIALTEQLSPTGQYNVDSAFNQSLAILGLASAGEQIPAQATDWLIDLQAVEGDLAGSWDDGFGTAGNADSTAMAVTALLASGQFAVDSIPRAVDFLSRTQLDSGGWEYAAGLGESANSTALVVLSLMLLGQDISSADSEWHRDGGSPLEALLAWQSETGAFQADFGDGRFDDFFSTVQSLPTISLATLQVPAPTAEPTEVIEPTATQEPSPEETAVPPTETPVSVPSPTPVEEVAEVAPEPTATATATAGGPPPAAGGDSTLPFWIIGAAIILLGAALYWLFRGRSA